MVSNVTLSNISVIVWRAALLISTDCTGSCISNYHTITTTMALCVISPSNNCVRQINKTTLIGLLGRVQVELEYQEYKSHLNNKLYQRVPILSNIRVLIPNQQIQKRSIWLVLRHLKVIVGLHWHISAFNNDY